MALQIQPQLFPCRAMGEWYMVIGDIVEEVDFLLLKGQSGGDGMDWSISPALVKETTVSIQLFKVIDVGW